VSVHLFVWFVFVCFYFYVCVCADQLIIDECGMSKEAESLVAIVSSRARHVVLIGDHRQLEPVVLDKSAADLGLSRSLFERYAQQAVTLTTQYRMVC